MRDRDAATRGLGDGCGPGEGFEPAHRRIGCGRHRSRQHPCSGGLTEAGEAGDDPVVRGLPKCFGGRGVEFVGVDAFDVQRAEQGARLPPSACSTRGGCRNCGRRSASWMWVAVSTSRHSTARPPQRGGDANLGQSGALGWVGAMASTAPGIGHSEVGVADAGEGLEEAQVVLPLECTQFLGFSDAPPSRPSAGATCGTRTGTKGRRCGAVEWVSSTTTTGLGGAAAARDRSAP